MFNLNAILKSDKQEEISNNEEDGEPIFEQSSYSDLVDKYYLDTNLTCDVNISKSNTIYLIFLLAKIRQ